METSIADRQKHVIMSSVFTGDTFSVYADEVQDVSLTLDGSRGV